MKARIIRSNIEVDVQPHYQEGWFVGFTETANPGLILYRPQDLVFSDSPESTHTDWDYFRREAAKDILAGMLSNPERIHIDNKRLGTIEDFANSAVIIADELIKQLKMGEEE